MTGGQRGIIPAVFLLSGSYSFKTIILYINNIVVLILNFPPFWKTMALLRLNMQQLTEIKMAFKTMCHSSKKNLKSLNTDRSLVKENYTEHKKRWTKYCTIVH